jgi:hypothetical protein
MLKTLSCILLTITALMIVCVSGGCAAKQTLSKYSTTVVPNSSTTATFSAPTSNPIYTVDALSDGFDPQLLLILIYTTVKFNNVSQTEITLVSDYPFEADIPAGGAFNFTFTIPGQYSVWEQSSPNSPTVIIVGA